MSSNLTLCFFFYNFTVLRFLTDHFLPFSIRTCTKRRLTDQLFIQKLNHKENFTIKTSFEIFFLMSFSVTPGCVTIAVSDEGRFLSVPGGPTSVFSELVWSRGVRVFGLKQSCNFLKRWSRL